MEFDVRAYLNLLRASQLQIRVSATYYRTYHDHFSFESFHGMFRPTNYAFHQGQRNNIGVRGSYTVPF